MLAVKGHVPTPKSVVDLMVGKLFAGRAPSAHDHLLDPGCGRGEFIDGVLRWCGQYSLDSPKIIGVELNPEHAGPARERFGSNPGIEVRTRDFLLPDDSRYDFIIGNPPYVPITGLDEAERTRYRKQYSTAVERFDLYLLFFEQCLRQLAPEGRLCLITPEKFEYTHSAQPLRRLLANRALVEVHHLDEETFPGLVTYPTVTTLVNRAPVRGERTEVIRRDGATLRVRLPVDGSSWAPVINPVCGAPTFGLTLEDVCERISCGIATGSDSVFVLAENEVPPTLRKFSYPTISGRQLGPHGPDEYRLTSAMLVPYDGKGKLLPETQLGDLLTFLSRPDIERRLKRRTCVSGRQRVWYRFHDNVPLEDMLKPKLLAKDITSEPHFWADAEGKVVPRHTAYYVVPKAGVPLKALQDYLNGPVAVGWLKSNCQRAANGFYRVQSAILKKLPVPIEFSQRADPTPRTPRRRDGHPASITPGHRQAVLPL